MRGSGSQLETTIRLQKAGSCRDCSHDTLRWDELGCGLEGCDVPFLFPRGTFQGIVLFPFLGKDR